MNSEKNSNFFLDPIYEDYSFLSQVREDTLITPLVDGKETFGIMADAIASAEKSVNIAAWVFNPEIRLIKSLKVLKRRVTNWGELLEAVATKGVTVRLLLTDLDPILQYDIHRTTWKSYRLMIKHINKLPGNLRHKLQCICSRHEASISLPIIVPNVLSPLLEKIVRRLNKTTVKKRLRNYYNAPGLWPLIEYDSKSRKFKLREELDLAIFPGSHHQKVCSIDGGIAFLGGLDVQKSRIDDKHHRLGLWHDIHCKVEGLIVDDIEKNFQSRWNKEVKIFLNFVNNVNRFVTTKKIPLTPVGGFVPLFESEKSTPNPVTRNKKVKAQIHRTLSENSFFKKAILKTPPKNLRDDIAKSYKLAIEGAKEFIYIENQYIRSLELADWIIASSKRNPNLSVIIVLPVAPEEILATQVDTVTNHGLFLQHEVLSKLKLELGNNIGFFSLGAKSRYKKKRKAVITYGSLQIYVHSKLLIVDDYYCSIGSANANPRGFYVDTEIAVGWINAEQVKKLRMKLWSELLGNPKGLQKLKPEMFLPKWIEIAKINSVLSPKRRKGFVLPHNINNHKGQKNDQLPDEFTFMFDFPGLMDSDELA